MSNNNFYVLGHKTQTLHIYQTFYSIASNPSIIMEARMI